MHSDQYVQVTLTTNELEQQLEMLRRDIRLDENLNKYPNPTADYLERTLSIVHEMLKILHDLELHQHIKDDMKTSPPIPFGVIRY